MNTNLLGTTKATAIFPPNTTKSDLDLFAESLSTSKDTEINATIKLNQDGSKTLSINDKHHIRLIVFPSKKSIARN